VMEEPVVVEVVVATVEVVEVEVVEVVIGMGMEVELVMAFVIVVGGRIASDFVMEVE